MEFKICTDKNEWDSFVSLSPQGNIFCTSLFLETLPDKFELPVILDAGKILLGAIVLKGEMGILNAPYPFTIYQGILCYEGFRDMAFHKRSSWLLEKLTIFINEMGQRYEKMSFCLSHKFEDLRGIQWYHYNEPNLGLFKIDLRYTGILDLSTISDFETYLTTVRSVRRQEYKKAQKEGFTVEKTNDIQLLNRLHAMTFERQGLVRKNIEEQLLLNIAKVALEKGFGELLVCFDNKGISVSASLFLYDNCYGYYLFGANNPEYRKTGAGTFLIMENIKHCLGKGLLGVDFVGINSPNRGDFKTSFNAKPVPYFIIKWEMIK